MLARSTYEHAKRDIQIHSDTYTQILKDELVAETSTYRAVQIAFRVAREYHTVLTRTVFNRLKEVGGNAVDFYSPELSKDEKLREVNLAMDELVHNKYYGLTLPQRLRQSNLQLRSSVRRSGAVGAKLETRLQNITRVFNDKYPFGAHKNWDTRLFLAEAVRLEHILAKNLGTRKGERFVRWTLSHHHSQEDVCDKLALAVQLDVQHYIEVMGLDTDPHGLYFLENVPPIPHPNCQCTLRYIGKKKVAPKEHKENLFRRIWKAIFG